MSASVYAVSWFWVFVILSKAMKKYNKTEDPSIKRLISITKYLRQNKAMLLTFIMFISFAIPGFLTQVLKLEIFDDKDDKGFKVI